MTIIRSFGVTTLVALMSAHRIAAEQRGAAAFDQEAVEAIEAYLQSRWEAPERRRDPATEPRPSYN
jgi:hypothetical protein